MITLAHKLLCIARSGSWTANAAACMETTLTAGVFEQDAALVLLGDAVLWLLPEQSGSHTAPKPLVQQLPALELYGITAVYVEDTALWRNLSTESRLPISVKVLAAEQLPLLIAAAKHALVF